MNKKFNYKNFYHLFAVLIVSLFVSASAVFFISSSGLTVSQQSATVLLATNDKDRIIDSKIIPVDRLLALSRGKKPVKPDFSSPKVQRTRSGELVVSSYNIDNLSTPVSSADFPDNNDLSADSGWIVKLKDLSLAEKSAELEKGIKAQISNFEKDLFKKATTPQSLIAAKEEIKKLQQTKKQEKRTKLLAYKKELTSMQNAEIGEIRKIVSSITPKNRFQASFNGFFIDNIKESDIKKLKDKGYKIYPNGKVKAVLNQSVPLIGADKVWQTTSSTGESITGKGIKIAIIDTGVDYTHSDLGGCLGAGCKVAGGYDIVNKDNDPIDDMGHGTHVASIAAGNGVLKGVAPEATIYAYKVLDQYGGGYWSNVIAGIERAIDPNGDGDLSDSADIINMSLGGKGDPNDPVSQATDNAVKSGAIVVVAAGNNGSSPETILSPGTSREAITVGATTKNDSLAWFSARGPVVWRGGGAEGDDIEQYLIKPDIVAPGVSICAAQYDSAWNYAKCLDDKHISLNGTSMAAPHVAGVVALLKQKNPDWSPGDIKTALKHSAKVLKKYDIYSQGAGRLDALMAISISQKLPEASIKTNRRIWGTVDIIGTAKSDSFSKYSLYIKEDGNSSQDWREIFSSTEPVDNGALMASLNTLDLNSVRHLIKLTVWDTNGNYSEDIALVNVDNFGISNFYNEHLGYLKGKKEGNAERVEAMGFAPSNVSRTKIEYSLWNQQDWKIIYDGVYSSGSLVGTMDISSIKNGKYDFRLSVFDGKKWLYSKNLTKAIIHELADGWPLEFYAFPVSDFLVDNLDENPNDKEMISPQFAHCDNGWCGGSRWFLFNDGILKAIDSFVFQNQNYKPTESILPVSFYDSELQKNLIPVSGEAGSSMGLVDANGNYVYKWPPLPSLEEQERERLLEPISSEKNENNEDVFLLTHYVYGKDNFVNFELTLLNKNGTILNRFFGASPNNQLIMYSNKPYSAKLIKTENGSLKIFMPRYESHFGESDKLISDYYLDIYSLNGELEKRTHLYNDQESYVTDTGDFVFGDINKDGKKEAIVSFGVVHLDLYDKNLYDPNAYETRTYVLDLNGNIISNPFKISGYLLENQVLGRMNKQNLSIILSLSSTFPTSSTGEKIVSFDYQGNQGFNINTTPYKELTGVSVGDIDNDGLQEVIAGYRPFWFEGENSGFFVYNNTGILKNEIVVPTLGQVDLFKNYTPTITDIDNDGKVDILQKSEFISNDDTLYTRIYALGLNAPYQEKNLDWPMRMHDPQRTSALYYYESSSSSSSISSSVSSSSSSSSSDSSSSQSSSSSVSSSSSSIKNKPPEIKSISGPTILPLGEKGKWTIKAFDPENGKLTYRPKWNVKNPLAPEQEEPFVQTTTFTHTYSKAGVYEPTFIVKDDHGLTNESSITVNVIASSSSSSSSQPIFPTLSNIKATFVWIDDGNLTPATSSVNFSFTLNNSAPYYIYVNKKPDIFVSTSTTAKFGKLTLVDANPASLPTDKSLKFVIPSNSSRSFNFYGTFGNYGFAGTEELKITKIYFGNSPDKAQQFNLNKGLDGLKVVVTF